MVKRSTEQDIRNKKFVGRKGIIKGTLWSRIREQNSMDRTLGDCWQWETNGKCSEGDNCSFRQDINNRAKRHSRIRLRVLSCSRMREMRREPEVFEARVPVVECLEGQARIYSKKHLHQFIL